MKGLGVVVYGCFQNDREMSSLMEWHSGVDFVLQTYHYIYTCRTRPDSDSSPCRGDDRLKLLLRQK